MNSSLREGGEEGRGKRGGRGKKAYLLAPPHGDQEVVGQLPHRVRHGGPDHHAAQGVVLRRGWQGVLDCVDRWEAGGFQVGGEEVDEAVEGYAGHYVDE